MSKLRDYIKHLIDKAVRETGKKKTRLFLDSGIDPSNMNQFLKGERAISDENLRRIGESGLFATDYNDLRRLKAIDEFGEDLLLRWADEIKKDSETNCCGDVMGEKA
jgi:hypothetical protein